MNFAYIVKSCGGHARSIADAILYDHPDATILFVDEKAGEGERILGFPVVRVLPESGCRFIPGSGDNAKRKKECAGRELATYIAKSAHVGRLAQIGDGCETVIPALKEDAWIKSLGPITDYYKESGKCAKGDGQSPWSFRYSIAMSTAAGKENGSDGLQLGTPFEVQYQYNTAQFEGAFFVSVKFYKLDFSDPEVQEIVFRIVKGVYGEDLGNVLLYGKETDADKAAKKPNNMNVTVKKDEMRVRFTRTAMDLGKPNASLYF